MNMSKISHVIAAVSTAIVFASFAYTVQAGTERSPVDGCIECGQALLSCAQGVLAESNACVTSCGGDHVCLEACGDNAQTGINSCKASYEACKDSSCTLPAGRP